MTWTRQQRDKDRHEKLVLQGPVPTTKRIEMEEPPQDLPTPGAKLVDLEEQHG